MRLQLRLALISVAPVHEHLNPRPMAQEAATARETARCRGHDDHEGHGTGRGGLLRRRTRHGAATGGRHSRAGTRRRPPPVLRPSRRRRRRSLQLGGGQSASRRRPSPSPRWITSPRNEKRNLMSWFSRMTRLGLAFGIPNRVVVWS